jgi:hypothetical protein
VQGGLSVGSFEIMHNQAVDAELSSMACRSSCKCSAFYGKEEPKHIAEFDEYLDLTPIG